MHTVEYYHWLARCVIDRPLPGPTRIELRLVPAAFDHARWALEAAAVRQPYVMLCPVATGRHHGQAKAWDGFARLCSDLIASGPPAAPSPPPPQPAPLVTALPRPPAL